MINCLALFNTIWSEKHYKNDEFTHFRIFDQFGQSNHCNLVITSKQLNILRFCCHDEDRVSQIAGKVKNGVHDVWNDFYKLFCFSWITEECPINGAKQAYNGNVLKFFNFGTLNAFWAVFVLFCEKNQDPGDPQILFKTLNILWELSWSPCETIGWVCIATFENFLFSYLMWDTLLYTTPCMPV